MENLNEHQENHILNLNLHKCLDKILCKVNLKKAFSSLKNDNSSSKMIIILDISGSMGQLVPRLIQNIIPSFINNLYPNDPDFKVDVVTFSDNADLYQGNAKEIKSYNKIRANGCTYMSTAVDLVYTLISSYTENKKIKNFRILSLSDGELHDQEKTIKSSTNLKNLCLLRGLNVNSQAVRLYTSVSEPDTRGLSSMMQLSTKGGQLLKDICECNKLENEEIAEIITNMFKNDGICDNIILKNKMGTKVFQWETWEEKNDKINLFEGENSFWLSFDNIENIDIIKYIEENFEIDLGENNHEIKIDIKCSFKDNIALNNYQEIIKDKIDFYMKKLKILKVVNTEESLKEIDSIIDFFNSLENSLYSSLDSKNISTSENAKNFKLIERTQRIKLMIQKRKTSIANLMKAIKNDDKVNQLNSKQQAEYLRSIDITDKTGKGLAKRAFVEGTEFDETIKKEIKQIHDNFNELKDVKEELLHDSFYSACNTLDGIKAVCQFYEDSTKDGTFEEITANDILKIINIVGISAFAEIGNYPDPMTYRITNLYPSSFVSISDILIVHELTKGKMLTEIGNQDNKISTVIPYFEDEKILKFLLKYSPKLLEYSASVGMRRILADIPYTNEYTVLGGLWKLISMILKDKNKKEIYGKIFATLATNYLITSGNHFHYVLDLLEKQKEKDKNGLSIFIANNGITNMMAPLLLYQKEHSGEEAEEMIQRIIRATFQFEVYQYVRKIIKKQGNDQEIFIKNFLIDLLNINISENKTKPSENFVENLPEPKFYENYSLNEAKLEELYKKMWWIDYIVVTPHLLKTALSEEPIKEIKKIEINEINEDIFRTKVGINFESKIFKLFCVIQSFLQHDQASRSDTKLKVMKILDLGDFEKADRYVKDYVKNIFSKQYQEDLKEKANQEKIIITKELVDKLMKEKNYNTFKSLLENGITKGVISYKLTDSNSSGFIELFEALVKDNSNEEIPPLRDEKIYVLITGKDFYNKEENIFNKGNFWRNKKTFMAKKVLSNEMWNKIVENGKKNFHIYREMKNRQGHSNDFISYWAMGFKNLEEFKLSVSEEEFEKYASQHRNCCGFYKGKYCIMKRKLRKIEQ